MNEFEDQFMGDCGVEGRAEVHKEHPYICVGVLQGGQGCVECDGDSVLWGSVCLMGKLVAVQVHRDAVSDVRQYHPLKAPHDYWGEGDWAVVIEAGNAEFVGIGTMVVDLRQVGTAACCRERVKMSVEAPANWSAHDLSIRPDTPSGPVALLGSILLKVDLTWWC